jgi:hypothetical protein
MKYKHIWDECMSGQPDNGLIFDQRLGVTIDICGYRFSRSPACRKRFISTVEGYILAKNCANYCTVDVVIQDS